MQPLVTIAVAVYNIDEKMLRLCLNSVAENTAESDEIIIVDDCSQNGSYEICREYEKKYPRITLYRTDKNSGIGYVRNLMIDKANGKWIYFVDGDDVMGAGAHESAEYAGGENADVLIYDYKSFEKDFVCDKTTFIAKYKLLDKDCTDRIAMACLAESPCDIFGHTASKGCTSKGYNREFLLNNKIRFIEDLKISEDSVFYADVLCRCKKAVYFPFTLYYYRSANEHSVTNAYNADMDGLRKLYLMYFDEKCERYFPGREDIKQLHRKYKIPSVIYRQLKLDIFHKNNPKPYAERKREFESFLSEEPYKSALEEFDCDGCGWIERALVFSLAKIRNFFALNILFKHPVVLKFYGGIKNRLRILFGR